MKIKAYAKVNLCLKIFKTKNKTKHKLDSILYLYKKMYDVVKIKKSKEPKVSYYFNNHLMGLDDCLVTKTLKYLHEKFSLNINYHIKIYKHIPIGAGLGGGSSDAAAVINYLLKKENINLDLEDIALNLGSDIPFFLSRYKIARVKNYGEYVSPIFDWKPKFDVEINNIFVSTEKIFQLLDNDSNFKSKVDVDQILKARIYKQHLDVVYNDLTKYIIENDKQLYQIAKNFEGKSWFSGAGSSVVTLKNEN